ncbi:MAG: hypothetical protein ABL983_23115 [Nitrospira sp.]
MMTEGSIDRKLKDDLFRFFKGRNAIDYWDMWERVISFLVIAGDLKGAERFGKAMRSESMKLKYSTLNETSVGTLSKVSSHLRRTLAAHLDLCMELSLAVTKTTGDGGDLSTRLWRKSNLIRHHLVAIPLLNYTSFDGNLASPSSASGLVIDYQKTVNTPRFVRFDECLEFVNSGCAKSNKKDAVARANEVYQQFHGSKHGDVTSELIGEEESK